MTQFFKKTKEERLALYKKLYIDKQLSWAEIAKQVDSYAQKVRRDAIKLGIKSRDKADAQIVALAHGRNVHPTKGKKLSNETKAKISENMGQVWDNLSEEEREKRSQIGKESWDKKSDQEKELFFRKSVAAIRQAAKDGSKMEKAIFKALSDNGYKVLKHQEHVLKNERFHIDLYVPSCRTAIEIDGPMHFEPVFGQEKMQKRQFKDSEKNGLILSSEMALIRVKLDRRESQRFTAHIISQILDLLQKIKTEFPKKNERYFEI